MHAVAQNIGQDLALVLPTLHAISGCDSTSSFSGLGKQKRLKVLEAHADIIATLKMFATNASEIEEPAKEACRSLVSLVYCGKPFSSLNTLRYELFSRKSLASEKLPPTEDAFGLHLKRANYQVFMWNHASEQNLQMPSPVGNGRKLDENGQVVPLQMTLPPAPEVVLTFVKCGCQNGCHTLRCKCRKDNLLCSNACGCEKESCANRALETDSDSDDESD